MSEQSATDQYIGVKNLLTPDNHALVLIDHQYPQLLSVTSHKHSTVSHNVTALAKAAKVFNVPTLLTTGVAEHQPLLKELQAVFPEQKPIDRTGLCSWDDQRVVDWVKQTGRKKLVMAGLWTEICLNLAVQGALGDGYQVYIVPDASGGADAESHALAVQRMVQAGAIPISTLAYPVELQRDWARTETVPAVLKIFEEHGHGFSRAIRWQQEMLGLKEGTR
jgi:nicotinamidase-related amidase